MPFAIPSFPARGLVFLRALMAVLLATAAAQAWPAAVGERCQVGSNVPQSLLCPVTNPCLRAIGNSYCSYVGKVCGWPGTPGANLGERRTYNGRQYECTATGFQPLGSNAAAATAEILIAQLRNAGVPFLALVQQVADTFALGGEVMATKLKDAGYPATGPVGAGGVAAVLRAVYDPTSVELAGWLKAAGWNTRTVASAIAQNFSISAAGMAMLLRDLDIGAAETYAALRNVFDRSAAAASAIIASTYALSESIPLLAEVLGSGEQVAQIILQVTPPGEQALEGAVQALMGMGSLSQALTREKLRALIDAIGRWSQAVIEAVLDRVFGVVFPSQTMTQLTTDLLAVPASLREPAAVSERLTGICTRAGYVVGNLALCGGAFTAFCQAAGVDPADAACWQRIVDLDVAGKLNVGSLAPRKKP